MEENQFAVSTEVIEEIDKISERRRPPTPRVAPWLVFPYGKDGCKFQAFYNPCEPNNRTCRKFIPELSRKAYWQKPSHQGWLLILRKDKDDHSVPDLNIGDFFLWNPLSLEIIRLPTFLNLIPEKYAIMDCVLSSPPSTTSNNTGGGNSMVFLIFGTKGLKDGHGHLLIYCRPGDTEWSKKDLTGMFEDSRFMKELLWFKGKLYVLSCLSELLEIENQTVHKEKKDSDDMTLSVRSFKVCEGTHYPPTLRGGGGMFGRFNVYFVQSNDEIFRIEFHYNLERFDKVNDLSILRLDFSKMAWVEVKCLGDHVLFLGEQTAASCSAAAMSFPRGCLFYTDGHADLSLYKFEVEDNSTTVILPCLKLPTPWVSPNWMMMPMTSIADNEEKENKSQGLYSEKVESIDDIPKTETISPWLLISRDNDTIYNYIDPMTSNEQYHMKLPGLLVGAIIRFSKNGWLLMSKGERTLFFYNPFTREIIQLPDVPHEYNTRYIFCGISFSSLPTSSDCVVFGIAEWYCPNDEKKELLIDKQVMLLIIEKVNDVWKPYKFHADNSRKFLACYNNPVFYKGNFYALDYNGTLGVFNLEDSRDERNFDKSNWEVLPETLTQFDGVNPSYLVECEGELLLVNFERPFGKLVEVFKLDPCKMKWVKVKSLGNYSLFISHTSSFSVIAPDSSMANKIYFSRLHGESERILYYSLDTGKYHYIGSEQSSEDFYNTKSMVNCTWIEPNWSPNPAQEYPQLIT